MACRALVPFPLTSARHLSYGTRRDLLRLARSISVAQMSLDPGSNLRSNSSVDVRRPDWWKFPEQCSHGHPWGPGRVTVGWMPCDCPPVQHNGAGFGHRYVSCREPGCPSICYSPRHEPRS